MSHYVPYLPSTSIQTMPHTYLSRHSHQHTDTHIIHTHTPTHTRTETEGQLEASSSSCFMSRRVSRRQQNLENFLIFNSHSTVFSLLYFNFCCTYFTYIVSFYFRRNYELSALKSFQLSLGSHAAYALFILFAYYLRCVVVAFSLCFSCGNCIYLCTNCMQ